MTDEEKALLETLRAHPDTVEFPKDVGAKMLAASMRRQSTPSSSPASLSSPPASPPPSKRDIGALESAGQGLARWGLLGFDDNVAGVAGALGAGYQHAVDDADGSTWDAMKQAYRDARDERRDDVEAAYQANPNAYRAGALGGLLLTAPLAELTASKVAAAAPEGAALATRALTEAKRAAPFSMLQGVGLGDHDDAAGIATDAVVNAGLGYLGGAAAPVAGAALKSTVGAVADRALPVVGKALADYGKKADQLRALTVTSAKNAQIGRESLLKELEQFPAGNYADSEAAFADFLRKSGLSKDWKATSESIKAKAEPMHEEANRMIGAVIDETDSGAKSALEEARGMREQADALLANAGGEVKLLKGRAKKDYLALLESADAAEQQARAAMASGKGVAERMRSTMLDEQRALGGDYGTLPESTKAYVDRLAEGVGRNDALGDVSMAQAQRRVRALEPESKWAHGADANVQAKARGAREETRALRERMDNSADAALTGAVPDSLKDSPLYELAKRGRFQTPAPKGSETAADLYRGSRSISQASGIAAEQAAGAIEKGSKRNLLSMKGVLGISSGNPAGIALALADFAVGGRVPAMRATAAEQARAAAGIVADPKKLAAALKDARVVKALGPYAEKLRSASTMAEAAAVRQQLLNMLQGDPDADARQQALEEMDR
jgi:hypothetical protein